MLVPQSPSTHTRDHLPRLDAFGVFPMVRISCAKWPTHLRLSKDVQLGVRLSSQMLSPAPGPGPGVKKPITPRLLPTRHGFSASILIEILQNLDTPETMPALAVDSLRLLNRQIGQSPCSEAEWKDDPFYKPGAAKPWNRRFPPPAGLMCRGIRILAQTTLHVGEPEKSISHRERHGDSSACHTVLPLPEGGLSKKVLLTCPGETEFRSRGASLPPLPVSSGRGAPRGEIPHWKWLNKKCESAIAPLRRSACHHMVEMPGTDSPILDGPPS
jgi:hypothetical protein